MQTVKELTRRASPGGRPQPLAFHEGTLWLGCWDTSKLYAIDPKTWAVLEELDLPGKPYGLASFGGELRIVVSIGEDDDRYFFRFVPGHAFDAASQTACPELSGSHLTSDGTTLYLTQMGLGKILAFDSAGAVLREIALPSRCAGIGYGAGSFHMIAADDEFEDLNFATLDVSTSKPEAVLIAPMAEDARSLAFDGTSWWTNYRELSEVVSFATN